MELVRDCDTGAIHAGEGRHPDRSKEVLEKGGTPIALDKDGPALVLSPPDPIIHSPFFSPFFNPLFRGLCDRPQGLREETMCSKTVDPMVGMLSHGRHARLRPAAEWVQPAPRCSLACTTVGPRMESGILRSADPVRSRRTPCCRTASWRAPMQACGALQARSWPDAAEVGLSGKSIRHSVGDRGPCTGRSRGGPNSHQAESLLVRHSDACVTYCSQCFVLVHRHAREHSTSMAPLRFLFARTRREPEQGRSRRAWDRWPAVASGGPLLRGTPPSSSRPNPRPQASALSVAARASQSSAT